jgi:hypothetical protein
MRSRTGIVLIGHSGIDAECTSKVDIYIGVGGTLLVQGNWQGIDNGKGKHFGSLLSVIRLLPALKAMSDHPKRLD